MILPLTIFAQLAASCAPSVNVDTLASVARTESRFSTLAIGDNSSRKSYSPATEQEAVAIATNLLRQGHSLDLGLMQINSANLPGLGLSVAEAFDACRSMAGGARVLAAGYQPSVGEDTQPALLRALSRYNTGDAERGFSNGYVRRVQLAAQEVVPAIRLGGTGVVVGREGREVVAAPPAPPPPPPPPAWDVYGRASYLRQHSGVVAPVAGPAIPTAPVAPGAPMTAQPLAPVQLHTVNAAPSASGGQ